MFQLLFTIFIVAAVSVLAQNETDFDSTRNAKGYQSYLIFINRVDLFQSFLIIF
jgi:hypothetical protein